MAVGRPGPAGVRGFLVAFMGDITILRDFLESQNVAECFSVWLKPKPRFVMVYSHPNSQSWTNADDEFVCSSLH